jgi:radical SAM protein with 4Fe4S-binding SPASM domain
MSKTNVATLGLHLLEVEITTRCDKNCAHCYNRTNKCQDLPIEEVIKLIDWAEVHGVSKFIVSGGEAIMHPEFTELINFLKQRKPNLKMVIQSNGLIGEVDIEQVKVFDIVHLSFETDDSGVREISVEDTLETARRFMDAGIYSYLFATIHPGNVDKIDWMVEVARRHGLDIGFNLCIPGENEQLRLSREQRIATVNKLHKLYVAKKTLRFSSPFAAILKDQKTDSYVGIKGGCTAGVAACVVIPSGDVIPCPFFRLKAGSIYESDLEKIWLESEIFRTLRNRRSFEEPCGQCQYLSHCGGCRVRAYAQSNKLNGFDPDCIL